MKKTLPLFSFLCVLFVIVCTMHLNAQTGTLCGRNDYLQVLGGEYIVYNNIWGSSAGEQCIDVNGTGFTVTLSTHNSTGVAAYPCIFKGYHHWLTSTSNSGLPIRISEIGSVPISWTVDGTNAGGTWNISYESWFSTTGASNPANGGELMVWINYSGGATPGGSKVGTVNLEGYTWDVYYADWDWNYVAYKITSPIKTISFDFKPFIDDSVSRGYLSSSWYLDALEAGFEIWSDGQGLQSVSFSGSANGGSTTPTPTQPPTQTPTTQIGDVNNSNSIDIVDALLVAQYYVGLNPSNFDSSRADANCNGSIDIVDALLIAQYYVGLIDHFC
jgi:hypothetical protein